SLLYLQNVGLMFVRIRTRAALAASFVVAELASAISPHTSATSPPTSTMLPTRKKMNRTRTYVQPHSWHIGHYVEVLFRLSFEQAA
ncbi:MAG: hypothetical protein ACJ788_00555, partial [Ktedonobacteraceae bacterium]